MPPSRSDPDGRLARGPSSRRPPRGARRRGRRAGARMRRCWSADDGSGTSCRSSLDLLAVCRRATADRPSLLRGPSSYTVEIQSLNPSELDAVLETAHRIATPDDDRFAADELLGSDIIRYVGV